MTASRDALSDEQIRWLRLRAQQLVPGSGAASDVAAVLRRVVGIQAQDARAAALSVRARCPGIAAEDVQSALEETRTVVRTWLMRYTIHLAAAEDVRALLSVLGPRFKKTSRRRRAQLGLDDATADRGAETLEAVLRREGPLTRDEIRAVPDMEGVPLDGQAAPHLIGYAALGGRVCHGPERDGDPTYVVLDDWIDGATPPADADALAMLTRRYLSAYGPAGPRDMAAWSGLTLTRVREGFERIEDELTAVSAGEETLWMRAEDARPSIAPPEEPAVRLLPKYDTLLLGYRDRDWVLPPDYASRIHPGGGLLRRSVLVDGRIVGTWDPEREGDDTLRVAVELFEDIAPDARDALAAEADDVGRFFGKTGRLEIA